MNKKLTEEEKELKNRAEIRINDFFKLYTDEMKLFKLYSIEYCKNRVFLKFSSTKRNDDFFELGERLKKIVTLKNKY